MDILTFNEFINESKNNFGPKTKKFTDKIKDWEWFSEIKDTDEFPMGKEWEDGIKDLRISKAEAIVSFFDATGSAKEVKDAAKDAGLKFKEVKSSDGFSDGIVFSGKQ